MKRMVLQATFGVMTVLTFLVMGPTRGWSQTNSPINGPISQQPTYPGQSRSPRSGVQPPGIDAPDTDATLTRLADQQAKTRNSERQKKLELDTQRLLSLATELKEQVDKTDKNILSVDVVKKAEEIERLARSVKERMKG